MCDHPDLWHVLLCDVGSEDTDDPVEHLGPHYLSIDRVACGEIPPSKKVRDVHLNHLRYPEKSDCSACASAILAM